MFRDSDALTHDPRLVALNGGLTSDEEEEEDADDRHFYAYRVAGQIRMVEGLGRAPSRRQLIRALSLRTPACEFLAGPTRSFDELDRLLLMDGHPNDAQAMVGAGTVSYRDSWPDEEGAREREQWDKANVGDRFE